MRLYIPLFLLSILSVGCNKADHTRTSSRVLTSGADVSLAGAPAHDLLGNIDGLMPVLFKLKAASLKVWVKPSENEFWVEIGTLQKDKPTYVYDNTAQQLRFQNCYDGWGYAVKID